MRLNRSRLIYGLLCLGVLLIGLVSRRFLGDIPFIRLYVGDVLWALMVYLGLAVVFPVWSFRRVGLAATLIAFGIEISQLYHADWIDRIRATTIGGLVLGFSFVWTDLVCYSVGVCIGLLLDTRLMPDRCKSDASKKAGRVHLKKACSGKQAFFTK